MQDAFAVLRSLQRCQSWPWHTRGRGHSCAARHSQPVDAAVSLGTQPYRLHHGQPCSWDALWPHVLVVHPGNFCRLSAQAAAGRRPRWPGCQKTCSFGTTSCADVKCIAVLPLVLCQWLATSAAIWDADSTTTMVSDRHHHSQGIEVPALIGFVFTQTCKCC